MKNIPVSGSHCVAVLLRTNLNGRRTLWVRTLTNSQTRQHVLKVHHPQRQDNA